MTSSYRIPIAIIVGGIIIAATLYVLMPQSSIENHVLLVRPVGASDHILGNPTAPVMIIEYSDFDCEYCKDFHVVLHELIANEGIGGNTAWVFRHFPLTEIHQNAFTLAKASECVAEVSGPEAFWRFADELFRNQPVSPARLGELAASAHIPGEAFAACYASGAESAALGERILADRENALSMGAKGAPFTVILAQGRAVAIAGAYSYDAMRQLIDEALGK